MPIDLTDPAYAVLKALWPTLNPGTTQQKCDQVNAKTVALPRSIEVSPTQILNACAAADLLALTETQKSLLNLLFQGRSVDVSKNSVVRSVLLNIFAGKPSLTNLAALVAPYDNYVQLWYATPIDQGGGGFGSGNPITPDLCAQLNLV